METKVVNYNELCNALKEENRRLAELLRPIGCERCVSLQDISEGTMNSAFQAGVNFASIGSVDPETCKDYGSALIVAASAAKNFKYNGYKIIFGKEA